LLRTERRVSFVSSLFSHLPTRAEDAESRQHWSKTKQGRANACRKLGIDSSIVQSTRQEKEPPSTTVLANAMSAIIGAVWLDLEKQNESTATARMKVFNILRQIDLVTADTTQDGLTTAIEDTTPVLEGNPDHQRTTSEGVPNFNALDVTAGQNTITMGVDIFQRPSESQASMFAGLFPDPLLFYDVTSNVDPGLLNETHGAFSVSKPIFDY
jgi:hypothetical protein